MENEFEFRMKRDNIEVSVSGKNKEYLPDIVEAFVSFLLAIGYHKGSIDRCIRWSGNENEDI